ncbi:transporter substrate-binding domain-containing protein [Gymnodinialimonas sp. 2305UL16-5]|uniref:transporter substrate-binding domain-containing protein n=1 Tax=Gymnodinialimonas mytili TaxID=3126503 RepID=UPI0030B6338A
MRQSSLSLYAALFATCAIAQPAQADLLDDVLSRGELRCAVVLDFPPMGYRGPDNEPLGMDVDICADLAAEMGIDYQILGVTWAERIPALISGRADVAVASSSDTLERAQTVGFTIPYMVFQFQALVPADSDITEWEDLRDAHVGAAIGTTYESNFSEYREANWPDNDGQLTTFQSENESFMAVSQGRVDATIGSDTAIANIVASGQFGDLRPGPIAPFGADIVGFMTVRQEFGWLNYLDLYINRAYRSGRLQEFYEEHIGGDMPDLTIPGVYR